jgi:hypothetical protein
LRTCILVGWLIPGEVVVSQGRALTVRIGGLYFMPYG